MPSAPEYHRLEVTHVIDETADAKSFVLALPRALEETFRYAAGQFCSFRATIAGETVARCYSMSSSPDTGEPFATTVKRVAGGRMSNWMNDTLKAGDTIEAQPPAGRFVLQETAAPLVAFAGGSGITPIASILKTALATTQRALHLVYANRSADDVIFAAALERLRADSGGRLTIHHHHDADAGFLDAAACAALAGDRPEAEFYVCGPAAFMGVVDRALDEIGVAPDRRFVEQFTLPDEEPAAEDDDAPATESLVLRLEGRKHTLDYVAGDTVLEAARRVGLSPPFSCEAGSCATCMARVTEGTVRMRANAALSDDEVAEGWTLTCQARPTSRTVVIDYDA